MLVHQGPDFRTIPASQRTPCAAGAGRGGNTTPPVCISYPFPQGDHPQQPTEAARIRARISALLKEVDMPLVVLPEQRGGNPAQAFAVAALSDGPMSEGGKCNV